MVKCQSPLPDYRSIAQLLIQAEPDIAELRRLLCTDIALCIPTSRGGLTVRLRQDGCIEIIPPQGSAPHLLKAQGDSLPGELRDALKTTDKH